MTVQNLTTSMVIHFSDDLESQCASFYSHLAERHPDHASAFGGASQQCQKHRVWITRTYQETISDALEACFCFQGMQLEDFGDAPRLPDDASLEDSLRQAIRLEDRAVTFYEEAAERSKALLATIPGAFRRVAKKRAGRKRQWEELLRNLQSSSNH
jgi:hypothetical protein